MTVEENLKFRITKLRTIQNTIKTQAPTRQGGALTQPYQGWSNFIDNEISRLNAILETSLFPDAPAKIPLAAEKPQEVVKPEVSHQPALPEPSESNPGASILNPPRSGTIRRVQKFIDDHHGWLSTNRRN